MMRLELSRFVESDLDDIASYIAQDKPRLTAVGNYAILLRVTGGAVRIERVVYGGRDLSGISGT